MVALMQMVKATEKSDCAGGLRAMAPFFALDSLDIVGVRIWQLFNDVCAKNPIHALACLRAVQFGLITDEQLNTAIDNKGAGLDPEVILAQVKEVLPGFGEKA